MKMTPEEAERIGVELAGQIIKRAYTEGDGTADALMILNSLLSATICSVVAQPGHMKALALLTRECAVDLDEWAKLHGPPAGNA